jgi:hypothetical protein
MYKKEKRFTSNEIKMLKLFFKSYAIYVLTMILIKDLQCYHFVNNNRLAINTNLKDA